MYRRSNVKDLLGDVTQFLKETKIIKFNLKNRYEFSNQNNNAKIICTYFGMHYLSSENYNFDIKLS